MIQIKRKKTKYTEFYSTSIKISKRCFVDEPYVLSTQVQQVFYLDDYNRRGNWKVVEKVIHRYIWDVPSMTSTDENEEETFVNREAYQEDASGDINVTFDNTNINTSLVREEVPSTELDALTINLQMDPNYKDGFLSDHEDTDEEALLGDMEHDDQESKTDSDDDD